MEIAIVLGLVLLNGLFAMSEIALMTSRKARLQKLSEAGVSAMLVGESLMRSPDIGAKVRELYGK